MITRQLGLKKIIILWVLIMIVYVEITQVKHISMDNLVESIKKKYFLDNFFLKRLFYYQM